jgi:hypothetical protein
MTSDPKPACHPLRTLGLTLALTACQPPLPPTPPSPPPAPVEGALYLIDPAIAENDAEFRGPMTLQTEPNGALRLAWMNARHIVLAEPAGPLDARLRIEGPIRLHQALGAPPDATFTLYLVRQETGPIYDPTYVPMCGVRPVTHLAVYQANGRFAFAASTGAFGAQGARACSTAVAYLAAPPAL